jgi:hypothetical protein
MNEDSKMVHPALGFALRLPIELIADSQLQYKWATCKSRPSELYLKPEFPLMQKDRQMWRHVYWLCKKKHPTLGPLVRQALRFEISPKDFFVELKKVKYEKKVRPKKANASAKPGAKQTASAKTAKTATTTTTTTTALAESLSSVSLV